MKQTNNNFVEIPPSQFFVLQKKAQYRSVCSLPGWEDCVIKSFSGIMFKHYLYNDEFLVTVSIINNKKINGLPFTDIGAVLPIKGAVILDLESFKQDCLNFFHQPFVLLVNSFVCPVIENNDTEDLVDFVLDLRSCKNSQDIIFGMRKTLKHIIKKDKKYAVSSSANLAELKQLYRLYIKNLRQKKNLILPFEFFEFFYAQKDAIFLCARNRDNQIIGFSLFLDTEKGVHYSLSAVDVLYRKEYVAHQILWHAIEQAVIKQKEYVQLGGTRKDAPLSVFKKGWGAKPFPIYYVSSNSTSHESMRESPFRILYGKLPLWVIPYVSRILWKKVL
ncbi:MAG: hypothetical protein CL685_03920 [Candidatus Magasanikbacteria bacterium]|nr:hypothetical protein [Candidatus Magasanikbacteria bacterium]|tara:strand:- start:1763 stop:2758 length:996 start_codon:yes stop_codon:yes gene_type:complete